MLEQSFRCLHVDGRVWTVVCFAHFVVVDVLCCTKRKKKEKKNFGAIIWRISRGWVGEGCIFEMLGQRQSPRWKLKLHPRDRNHKVTVTRPPFTGVSRSHWWQVSQEQAIGLSSFLLSHFPNFGLGCWHVERTKLLYSISPMCVLPWNPGESLQTSSVYRAQVKTLPKVCLFIYLFIYARWRTTPMGDKL